MSVRRGAPYADRVEEAGRVLIYEGHDVPSYRDGPAPKSVDQPRWTPQGKPTQNGLFFEAAVAFKSSFAPAEQVRAYEKLRDGIWVYNGMFRLVDAWTESDGVREVFKFRLEIDGSGASSNGNRDRSLERTRMIPSAVKRAVWSRDGGRCVTCGATDNLHFDHVIPYSKGGSSLTEENIQLLCARHNLGKRDRIG
jgi:hypothetical protein